MPLSIQELKLQYAQPGIVESLLVRPKALKDPQLVEYVEAIADSGLKGDHYAGKKGKRQVTLIQQEYLLAVASMMSMPAIRHE